MAGCDLLSSSLVFMLPPALNFVLSGSLMKKSSSVSKRLLGRLALSLVSFLFVFSVLEFALRIFYPKYEYAAESQYDRNSIRIWSRRANTRYYRRHPDTERIHAVYHNNLGLRQHRNFSSEDLRAATNLGFFGDSFAENQRLPSQYSFSEPLDYLLNRAGKAFNVLNFGVDGYGPDRTSLSSIISNQRMPYNWIMSSIFSASTISVTSTRTNSFRSDRREPWSEIQV